VAGVAAACAASSDARVRAICVAGALKIYWEQVPKIYTKFGSILIAEPLENVFSKNKFSKNQKLVFFFFRGRSAWAAFEKGGGDKVEILVVYFRVDFVRELPAGPQRCVTFVWTTTQGDFVAYCILRQSWSDDKS
jgi:hypothetical protein